MVLSVGDETFYPLGMPSRAVPANLLVEGADVSRNVERRLDGPTDGLLRRREFVGTERGSVCLERVLLRRGSVADCRTDFDERWSGRLGLRGGDCAVDGLYVIPILDGDRVPAGGIESARRVFGGCEGRGAGERDSIRIEENDQLAELQVTGKRARLIGDALHQVPIANDDVGVVIDDRVTRTVEDAAQVRLGDGESDGIGEALAERAGCHLDTVCDVALRVSGGQAVPLTERFDLGEGEVIAREMQERVQERRAVPGRENETIAVEPGRIGRIVPQVARPQGMSHCGRSEGQSWVSGPCLLDRVAREESQCVDAVRFGPFVCSNHRRSPFSLAFRGSRR